MPSPERPPRVLRDSAELHAVVHPVRIRLLEELAFAGAATATELSDRIGESPANCSWHLRQLAKYGFVEEAGGGSGRQRPWRLVIQIKQLPTGEVPTDVREAATTFRRHMVAREYEALRAWLATGHADPPEWRDAAFVTQNVGWCTAGELSDVFREVSAVLDRYVHRVNDASSRPTGARPIRFLAWGVPAQPLPIRDDRDPPP